MFAHKTIQFYTFPIPCRIAEVIFSSLLGSLLFISIVLFLIFLASLGRLQQISKQFCREKLSTTVLQIIEKIESQNSDCWMQDYHSLSLTYFLIIISAQVSNSIPHTLTQGWKSSLLAVLQLLQYYYDVSMYPLLIMKIENYSEGVHFCPGSPLPLNYPPP